MVLIYGREKEAHTVLEEVSRDLKRYLEIGKYASVLKEKAGVGIGFVDGDIEILYQREKN